ncbi:MAG: hypothetical protein SAK29_02935 [Scytonema sp. PMC 1069.18]|nr:hypothetical protein [Scytonema sp. PMC 1069.18]MEC4881064.1 hypothetical protein [Scytonema sp. PMC 1070.18]
MNTLKKARAPPLAVQILYAFGRVGIFGNYRMQIQTIKFRLVFTSKVQKKLDALPSTDRKQYDKAFECFANHGPGYRSLRTHRYRYKDSDTWSSSASMAKRFYWRYTEEQSIEVTNIDSH